MEPPATARPNAVDAAPRQMPHSDRSPPPTNDGPTHRYFHPHDRVRRGRRHFHRLDTMATIRGPSLQIISMPFTRTGSSLDVQHACRGRMYPSTALFDGRLRRQTRSPSPRPSPRPRTRSRSSTRGRRGHSGPARTAFRGSSRSGASSPRRSRRNENRASVDFVSKLSTSVCLLKISHFTGSAKCAIYERVEREVVPIS